MLTSREINTMTHVLSIEVNTNEVLQKSFLLGYGQTMYVSEDNIYLAYTQMNITHQ